jgi:hypothetical protein
VSMVVASCAPVDLRSGKRQGWHLYNVGSRRAARSTGRQRTGRRSGSSVGRTGSAAGMSCGVRFWPLATFIGRRGDGTRLQCHDTATGVDLRAERTGDGPLDISERTSTAPHELPRDGLAFPGDRHEGNRRLEAVRLLGGLPEKFG